MIYSHLIMLIKVIQTLFTLLMLVLATGAFLKYGFFYDEWFVALIPAWFTVFLAYLATMIKRSAVIRVIIASLTILFPWSVSAVITLTDPDNEQLIIHTNTDFSVDAINDLGRLIFEGRDYQSLDALSPGDPIVLFAYNNDIPLTDVANRVDLASELGGFDNYMIFLTPEPDSPKELIESIAEKKFAHLVKALILSPYLVGSSYFDNYPKFKNRYIDTTNKACFAQFDIAETMSWHYLDSDKIAQVSQTYSHLYDEYFKEQPFLYLSASKLDSRNSGLPDLIYFPVDHAILMPVEAHDCEKKNISSASVFSQIFDGEYRSLAYTVYRSLKPHEFELTASFVPVYQRPLEFLLKTLLTEKVTNSILEQQLKHFKTISPSWLVSV